MSEKGTSPNEDAAWQNEPSSRKKRKGRGSSLSPATDMIEKLLADTQPTKRGRLTTSPFRSTQSHGHDTSFGLDSTTLSSPRSCCSSRNKKNSNSFSTKNNETTQTSSSSCSQHSQLQGFVSSPSSIFRPKHAKHSSHSRGSPPIGSSNWRRSILTYSSSGDSSHSINGIRSPTDTMLRKFRRERQEEERNLQQIDVKHGRSSSSATKSMKPSLQIVTTTNVYYDSHLQFVGQRMDEQLEADNKIIESANKGLAMGLQEVSKMVSGHQKLLNSTNSKQHRTKKTAIKSATKAMDEYSAARTTNSPYEDSSYTRSVSSYPRSRPVAQSSMHGYQPTSPDYRPTSPAYYQPTSPSNSATSFVYQPTSPDYQPTSPAYRSPSPSFSLTTPAYQPTSPAGTFSEKMKQNRTFFPSGSSEEEEEKSSGDGGAKGTEVSSCVVNIKCAIFLKKLIVPPFLIAGPQDCQEESWNWPPE